MTETQLLRATRARSDGTVAYPEAGEFEVTVVLADGRPHPHTGRISFTDASVSTRTGAVLVRADIPNPEETLRPGQYVRVLIGGAYRPGAMVVPQRAVMQGPKGAFVWVVDRESKAEQRPVTLGPWNGDLWIIESGLRAEDRVVVNGSMGLRPGTPLTIGRILPATDAGNTSDSAAAGASGTGRPVERNS